MKEICLGLGVVFGGLIIFSGMFAIPCALLLSIAGVQLFEVGIKKKQFFERFIENKFQSYEISIVDLKSQVDKHKSEIESMRMRMNVSSVYGKSQ